MNQALQYLVACADTGNFTEFLKNCDKDEEYEYHGAYGLTLYIKGRKVVRCTHDGKPLRLINV